jgi:hypothetical protein
MINNKNFYYIFFTYITFSCSLYHIIYWNEFGLNGLSLVSIDDLIKTAINSIFYVFLSVIIGLSIPFIIYKPKNESLNRKELIVRTIEMIIFYSIVIIIFNCFGNPNNLQISLIFAPSIIIEWINVDVIFDKEFKITINKNIIIYMILYLPLGTIGTAIVDSTNIYSNKEYMYSLIISKTIQHKTCDKSPKHDISREKNHFLNECKIDTLKYLGRNNDSFIFTDLKNIKIFFIKNDTIELIKKKRTND